MEHETSAQDAAVRGRRRVLEWEWAERRHYCGHDVAIGRPGPLSIVRVAFR